jgi:2-iminobutanoate/2-iminopropanoate deaminase
MKKIIPSLIVIVCFWSIASGQTSRTKRSANQRTEKMQKQTTVSRRVVSTGTARQSNIPLSQAIVTGDFVFVSGQIGVDPKTGEFAGAGLEEQAEQVFRNLSAVLEAAGSDLSHVVKTTVFLADMNDFNTMNEIYRRYFKEDPPARSTVQVARLPRNARIEIEAIAILKK